MTDGHDPASDPPGAAGKPAHKAATSKTAPKRPSAKRGAGSPNNSNGERAKQNGRPAGRRHLVARSSERRQLTDPKVMRALAHPMRLAILEALVREGPLTATAAAAILDDSPGNMSWHLNVLAKYGFVEEAEGGRGRSRPWRLVNLGNQYDDSNDDPELSLAGETFSKVILDRNFERAERWVDERRTYPAKWRKAAFNNSSIAYLTADELEELGDRILEMIVTYNERSLDIDKRPKGSRPVSISAVGHPLPSTPSGN